MKKNVQKLTPEDIINFPLENLVDGWHFRIIELSNGFFRVIAMDEWRRIVSRDGIDPDVLIQECKEDIASHKQKPE